MNRKTLVIAGLAVTALFIATKARTGESSAGLSLKTLKNMAYKSEWTRSGKAKLVDGIYSEQAAPGSATRTTVTLTDKVAYGKLDGKGAAAVILVADPGGSGTFCDLAAVIVRKGKPVNVAVANLGDRVFVNSLSIQENVVKLDLVIQRPGEPMTSPTHHVMQTYSLQKNKLVLTASEDASGPAPGVVGVTWKWEKFQGSDDKTVVVDEPEKYTIEFLPDGRVNIRADCNRGSGNYRINGSGLSIKILILTRAACPPESLSDVYIRDLNDAVSWVLEGGKLHLNLKIGTMVFEGGK